MTPHHERVRAVRLVAGIESCRRADEGEPPVSAAALLDLVARTRTRLRRLRLTHPGADGADQRAWKEAVYDAALAELSDGLGVPHALDDATVPPHVERARVERALHEALRRHDGAEIAWAD